VALGIGANTALFSVLDAVVLKSLPVRNPERLVVVSLRNARGDRLMGFSYPLYSELRARNQSLTGMLATTWGGDRMPLRVPPSSETEVATVSMVSGDFFEVLGVQAQLGRALSGSDDQPPGAHPVAVLSERYWRTRFGGSPSVIGQSVFIQNVPMTIVGIAPYGFFGSIVGELPDIWVPATLQPQLWPGPNFLNSANTTWLLLMGRLRPGVSQAQAQDNLERTFQQIQRDWQPTEKRKGLPEKPVMVLMPGSQGFSELRERFAKPLQILMGAVGLVLLIACVNVANLLLARAAVRQRELAIRLAVGASRHHLVGQFLTESLLLSLLGGAAGLLLAFWGTQTMIPLLADRGGALPLTISVDLRLLAFTAMVSVAAGLVFGIFPALRSATSGELSLAVRGTGRAPRLLFGKALVVFQIALSLMLVAGAALFVRTLQNLHSFDTGFDRKHVLMLRIDQQAAGYKGSQLAVLNRRLREEVEAVPGVRSVSQSAIPLMGGRSLTCCITVPGYIPAPGEHMDIRTNEISLRYFDTVGMTLLEGRGFTDQDRSAKPQQVVVNEAFVRRYFKGSKAVGRFFGFDGKGNLMQIVGVVHDARYDALREPSPPVAFFLVSGDDRVLRSLEIRVAGDPRLAASAVRRAVAAVDPRLPVREVITIGQLIDSSLAQERLMARLSGFFGLLALGLACLGIYGLMAFLVARRTNEIGIRMALGADRKRVMGLVLQDIAVLVVPGAFAGVLAALATTRVAASMLFGVTATDPLTLAIATGLLMTAALAAGYLPARRAAGVDPLNSLRHD
jgi:predicted permease